MSVWTRAHPELRILGDAAPVIMISLQAVNLNKSSEINGQWLYSFPRVYVRACVSLYFMCNRTKKTPQSPSTHMSQSPLSLLDVIYCTHTSASATGRDHKSKASSLLAAKKTHRYLSPTKRAINSVSQWGRHSSGPTWQEKAHTTHLPFTPFKQQGVYI